MYKLKSRSLPELPPTSSCIKQHILRCFFAVRLYTELLNPTFVNPTLFGWYKDTSGVLLPVKGFHEMPADYFVTCGCQTCSRRCSCRAKDLPCTEFCKCGDGCLND